MDEFELYIEDSTISDLYESGAEEWGAAFYWIGGGDHGVEYNLHIEVNGDEIYNASAIYKTDTEGEYLETDYNTFVHYEIDFEDPRWESKLRNAMRDAAYKFWGVDANR